MAKAITLVLIHAPLVLTFAAWVIHFRNRADLKNRRELLAVVFLTVSLVLWEPLLLWYILPLTDKPDVTYWRSLVPVASLGMGLAVAASLVAKGSAKALKWVVVLSSLGAVYLWLVVFVHAWPRPDY